MKVSAGIIYREHSIMKGSGGMQWGAVTKEIYCEGNRTDHVKYSNIKRQVPSR